MRSIAGGTTLDYNPSVNPNGGMAGGCDVSRSRIVITAMVRRWAVLLAFAAATAATVSAAPRCTQETLNVRGTAVTIAYCISGTPHSDGADEVVVPVSASYASARGSFGRTQELHFVAGEGPSRVLERLDLNRLGMAGVLHLTLVYAGGVVRVEGALLSPGGITIK